MTTVTVSPKYQVVIPKAARQALGVKPGQRVEVIVFEGRLELVPVRKPSDLRGFVKGIATDIPRDADRV